MARGLDVKANRCGPIVGATNGDERHQSNRAGYFAKISILEFSRRGNVGITATIQWHKAF